MPFALPEWVKTWSQFFHPVVQIMLLATAFYTLYLGLQVRKMRSAEGEEKNVLVLGLFSWQLITGLQIVQKIVSRMTAAS